VAYLRWARGRPHAAVDLELVNRGQTLLAVVLIGLAYLVVSSAIFVLPVFTQAVQGHSALATGVAMLPQGLITGLSTVVGQKLMYRVPLRRLVGIGFGVLAVCSTGLLALDASTPLWVTGAILAGRAAAIGLVITPLLAATQRDLEPAQQADANTLMIIVQRVGGSLGVSLIASMLAARLLVVGPISAFHEIGVLLTGVALLGLRLCIALNTSLDPRPPRSSPA
jgi:predicted MFS family arabinose efflux permease